MTNFTTAVNGSSDFFFTSRPRDYFRDQTIDSVVFFDPKMAPAKKPGIAPSHRFDYKGRSAVVTGDLKYHPPLIVSPANADLLVSEAISRTMTKSLESAAQFLPRQLFAQGVNEVRSHDWTIADDGSLYTLPLGSKEVKIGMIR